MISERLIVSFKLRFQPSVVILVFSELRYLKQCLFLCLTICWAFLMNYEMRTETSLVAWDLSCSRVGDSAERAERILKLSDGCAKCAYTEIDEISNRTRETEKLSQKYIPIKHYII